MEFSETRIALFGLEFLDLVGIRRLAVHDPFASRMFYVFGSDALIGCCVTIRRQFSRPSFM